MNCPGSVRLSRGAPDQKSEYSIEGDCAHKVLNLAVSRGLPASTWLDSEFYGVPVDEEMCDAVQIVCDYVAQLVALDPNARVLSEKKFSLGALNPKSPMFGTTDVVVILPRFATLVVIDLKYGRGVLVEVQDNPQTLYYALGALLDIELDASMRGTIRTVRTVIIQPRAAHQDGPVRTAEYPYLAVAEFAAELMDYAAATLKPDAPLVPGSHCRFCKAAGACPALKDRATALAQVEFDDLPADAPPKPETLPLDVLSDILDKADILEDWLTSCRAYVAAMLERGEDVPGWKLVAKRANRKWVADDLVLLWTREQGIDDAEVQAPIKLKSPAQLEKVLKPMKLAVPEDLIEQKSSGSTLAPTNDKRPALALGAAEDFKEDAL